MSGNSQIKLNLILIFSTCLFLSCLVALFFLSNIHLKVTQIQRMYKVEAELKQHIKEFSNQEEVLKKKLELVENEIERAKHKTP